MSDRIAAREFHRLKRLIKGIDLKKWLRDILSVGTTGVSLLYEVPDVEYEELRFLKTIESQSSELTIVDNPTNKSITFDLTVDASLIDHNSLANLTTGDPHTQYLEVANNLSDVSNAATSFDNIKQSATTTFEGVVEKGTLVEVQAGTDADKYASLADLDTVYVQHDEADSISTVMIQTDAVTATEINANVAGDGLGQNVSGALEVNVDDSTIEINSDTLRVKDDGITAAKVNPDVAGDGITQAVSGALDANVDGVSLETVSDTLQVRACGARVTRNAATTLADNTWYTVSYTAEDYDTDSFYSSGSPTRLTIPYDGLYFVHFQADFAISDTSDFVDAKMVEVALFINGSGSGFLADLHPTPGEHRIHLHYNNVIKFDANDYIEVKVRQQSDPSGSEIGEFFYFSCALIGRL